eukprot:PhM_4_TR14089/c1_g1_i1/m.106954
MCDGHGQLSAQHLHVVVGRQLQVVEARVNRRQRVARVRRRSATVEGRVLPHNRDLWIETADGLFPSAGHKHEEVPLRVGVQRHDVVHKGLDRRAAHVIAVPEHDIAPQLLRRGPQFVVRVAAHDLHQLRRGEDPEVRYWQHVVDAPANALHGTRDAVRHVVFPKKPNVVHNVVRRDADVLAVRCQRAPVAGGHEVELGRVEVGGAHRLDGLDGALHVGVHEREGLLRRHIFSEEHSEEGLVQSQRKRTSIPQGAGDEHTDDVPPPGQVGWGHHREARRRRRRVEGILHGATHPHVVPQRPPEVETDEREELRRDATAAADFALELHLQGKRARPDKVEDPQSIPAQVLATHGNGLSGLAPHGRAVQRRQVHARHDGVPEHLLHEGNTRRKREEPRTRAQRVHTHRVCR